MAKKVSIKIFDHLQKAEYWEAGDDRAPESYKHKVRRIHLRALLQRFHQVLKRKTVSKNIGESTLWWFKIINVTHYVNRLKKQNDIIVSINAEKITDQI